MRIIFKSITKEIVDTKCKEIYFNTINGRRGVLKNHIQENFILDKGLVKIVLHCGKILEYHIISGMANIQNNIFKITAMMK